MRKAIHLACVCKVQKPSPISRTWREPILPGCQRQERKHLNPNKLAAFFKCQRKAMQRWRVGGVEMSHMGRTKHTYKKKEGVSP